MTLSKSSTNPRRVLVGVENRQRLLAGASIFARAVCITYGPHGRTVLLDRAHGLLTTKDGITVAREIHLADPVANMACQTLREACLKVNNETGDGTTSVACVANALLQEGVKLVAAGYDPMLLAQGMQAAALEAQECVRSISRPAETQADLEHVALIASNGDHDIAKNMAEAVMAVGKNGNVSVEDGKGVETKLVFKDGMEFDRGVCSTLFLQGKTSRELPGVLVACIGAVLRTLEDVQDLLEVASQFGGRELLVIAEDVVGDALATMTLNDAKGIVKCVAIKAPGNFQLREYLGDIAAMSDATVIDPMTGGSWHTWDAQWFGMLSYATVQSQKTTLVALEDAKDLIRDRIQYITAQIPGCSSEYDRDRLKERRATLEGGLCVMEIGAPTEAALKEKRARVEDALGSVQSALHEGLVPGGGTAYLEASDGLLYINREDSPEFLAGWRAVAKALQAPLEQLAHNAGLDGRTIVETTVLRRQQDDTGWVGWDANLNACRDLGGNESPIVDPTRVVCTVIATAVSVIATLLTSEVSICSKQHRRS
jgi:chaperonin GroEL